MNPIQNFFNQIMTTYKAGEKPVQESIKNTASKVFSLLPKPVQAPLQEAGKMAQFAQQPGNTPQDFAESLPVVGGALKANRQWQEQNYVNEYNQQNDMLKKMGKKPLTPEEFNQHKQLVGMALSFGGEMTPVGSFTGSLEKSAAQGAAKTALLDVRGNPMNTAQTPFVSKGKPVEVNPETQSSMDAYAKNPNFANEPQAATPQTPQPAQPEPVTPGLPKIGSAEDTLTTAKKPNILTRAGNAIKSDVGKAQAPDAATSLFGPEHTANIQGALVRNGVDNYNQLPGAARNLYDNVINPELSSKPQLIKIDDVTSKIVSEMRKVAPGLDQAEAKNAAHAVINDMYDVSRNTTGGQTLAPTHIDTPALFNIRQGLNDTAAVRKYFNDVPLSNTNELATVAARDALSDVIAGAHPNIAQATRDYGLLKDAVPSLFKASQQGRGIGLNIPLGPNGTTVGIPSFLGGPIRDVVGGALRTGGKIAANPVGKGIGIAGVGAGLIGAGMAAEAAGLPQKIEDTFVKNSSGNAQNEGGNNKQQEGNVGTQSTSNIPQNLSDYKRDPQGNYDLTPLTTQTPIPGYLSPQDYKTQRDQLVQQLQDPSNRFVPQNAAMIQTQLDNLDKSYTAGQDQKKQYLATHQLTPEQTNFMQDAQGKWNPVLNDLSHRIQQLPPNFLNGFKTIDQLKQYNNGQYAALASEMQAIQAYAKKYLPGASDDLLPSIGQSEGQAYAKLDLLHRMMLAQYQGNLPAYTLVTNEIPGIPTNQFPGAQTPAPTTTPQSYQGLPPQAPGENLPPIVNALQPTALNAQIGGTP